MCRLARISLAESSNLVTSVALSLPLIATPLHVAEIYRTLTATKNNLQGK